MLYDISANADRTPNVRADSCNMMPRATGRHTHCLHSRCQKAARQAAMRSFRIPYARGSLSSYLGAGDPSDQWRTGMKIVIGSYGRKVAGGAMIGDPSKPAAHVAIWS
jgi:hypothetical protein